MRVKIEGKVYVAREDDINTDLIIPARYLNTSDSSELGKHAMEDLDPKRHPIPFLNKDGSSDYTFVVPGKNFGCGSSREHAVWALAAAGIEAVIAPGPVPFARIFYRNCVNEGGVIPMEYDATNNNLTDILETGEKVILDMNKEIPFLIRDKNGVGYPLKPFTGIAREIMDAGGLTAYNKAKLGLE